jgi:hypothetical protein
MSSDEKKEEPLTPIALSAGQVDERAHDAVFGTITDDGPNYRSVCVVYDSNSPSC